MKVNVKLVTVKQAITHFQRFPSFKITPGCYEGPGAIQYELGALPWALAKPNGKVRSHQKVAWHVGKNVKKL